jgi:hypothetical protein
MISVTAFSNNKPILNIKVWIFMMIKNRIKKCDILCIVKIIAFIVLGTFTFIVSLIFLPYEMFLLSTIIVFVSLRGVEKELHKYIGKDQPTFHTKG